MNSGKNEALGGKLSQQINYLRSPKTIRSHCEQVYELVKENKGLYFTLSEDKLEPLCDYVIQVMKENYPDLQIPFHSR